jgi:hypothetical protein
LLRQKRRNIFGGFAQDDRFFFFVEIGGGSCEPQVLRLASGLIVAPKCGRNIFGGFAQDDGVFCFVES